MARWMVIFLVTLLLTVVFARGLNTYLFSTLGVFFRPSANEEEAASGQGSSRQSAQVLFDKDDRNRERLADQQEHVRDQMERMRERMNKGRD